MSHAKHMYRFFRAIYAADLVSLVKDYEQDITPLSSLAPKE